MRSIWKYQNHTPMKEAWEAYTQSPEFIKAVRMMEQRGIKNAEAIMVDAFIAGWKAALKQQKS